MFRRNIWWVENIWCVEKYILKDGVPSDRLELTRVISPNVPMERDQQHLILSYPRDAPMEHDQRP